MPTETHLRFEWVADIRRFHDLRESWNLLGRSAVKTIFLTHAWLDTWLTNLARAAELHVMTAWDGDRLVAALPLFGDPRRGGGRRWAFMGTGPLTPNHLDIIAEPDVADQARAAFVDMLLAKSAEWDTLEFDKLPADTETASALEAAFAQAGFATMSSASAICPYCDLPPTFEQYLASRKKRPRKKIRQARERFAENQDRMTIACAQTDSEALSMLADLIRLHQARWNEKGYPGAFSDPHVVRFHESIVRSTLADGQLHMYALRDGTKTVAISYDYHIGDLMQGYLSSFDPQWSEWSPGVLTRAYVIENAIVLGATRFDFLEGTEQYKSDWGSGARENLRLSVFNHTLAGGLERIKLAARVASVRAARRWVPAPFKEQGHKVLAARRASRQGREK